MNDIDVNSLLIYFIGYNDNDVLDQTIMFKASTNDWLF